MNSNDNDSANPSDSGEDLKRKSGDDNSCSPGDSGDGGDVDDVNAGAVLDRENEEEERADVSRLGTKVRAGAVEASVMNPRSGVTKLIDEYCWKKKCGCKKVVQFPDLEQQLKNACSFVFLLCESPACFDHVNERFRACDCIRRLSIESQANSVQNLKAHFVSKKENRINQIQKVIAAGEGQRSSQKKCEKSNFHTSKGNQRFMTCWAMTRICCARHW